MTRYVQTDIGTGYNSATGINTELSAVETAIADTLSRKGDSPNQMQADLDMNSNQILNLPVPTTAGEPLRLADIGDLTGVITGSFVDIGGEQTITGAKTWEGESVFNNDATFNNDLVSTNLLQVTGVTDFDTDLRMRVTNKIILDGTLGSGVGNSYLQADVEDNIRTVINGVEVLNVDSTGIQVVGDVTLGVGDKLYLDGGVDTYIQEFTGNHVRFYTGSGAVFGYDASGLGVAPTGKLYLDGVSANGNTFIQQDTPDNMVFFTGPTGSERFNINVDGVQVTGEITVTGSITPQSGEKYGKKTISTSAPSGGADGDVWYVVA